MSFASQAYFASHLSAIPAGAFHGEEGEKKKGDCDIVRNRTTVRSNGLRRSHVACGSSFLAFSERKHGESELEKPLCICQPPSVMQNIFLNAVYYLISYFFQKMEGE